MEQGPRPESMQQEPSETHNDAALPLRCAGVLGFSATSGLDCQFFAERRPELALTRDERVRR